MIVSLIGKESINSITLSEKANGQYWLYTAINTEKPIRVIGIEGINNKWFIKSNRNYSIVDNNNNPLKTVEVSESASYKLKSSTGDSFCLFTEKATDDRQTFSKYLIRGNIKLVVGRNEQCDISINNHLISSKHFELIFSDGQWSVKDLNSSNGTFVNDVKLIGSKELSFGDIINAIGFKIIVGKNFIALNNPDNTVTVNSSALISYIKQEVSEVEDDEYELEETEYFYRSPRFKRDIKTATFKIDSPPESPLSEEMPWLLIMGSSLAMGAMSLVTLVTALISFNITSMVMGASMLLGTVLLPTISKKYEKKQKVKKEAYRQKKYKEYLDSIIIKINEESELQADIMKENFVPIRECESRILNTSRNLWERSMGQNDFLRLRLGIGEGNLDAEFHYSDRKFSINDDNLQEELYNICESPKKLSDIPITYSLFDDFISGVIGPRKETLEFAKGLIFQIASLYSYDEVKLVFIYDEDEKELFDYVKWLPHVWNDEKTFRYVATNQTEVKEISAQLEKVVEARKDVHESEMDEVTPYYVIFSFSSALALKAEMMKSILAEKENIHFSIVTFYDELRNVPKESSMIIELSNGSGKLFDKDDITGNSISFSPDIFISQQARDLSVKLANIPLNTVASGYKLPGMITFLQMFGVGKIEHLNVLTRWQENNPVKSLETEVGVNTYGELFKLDLHEKFHGPHGLVAGMTGSGKSEFIITYILSLAVNYHPNEVAFVLIDYKGGGMAKSFENLPHTVGIITNLDGSAIKRSLVSIEAELKRRQAIFAKVSKQIGVSNIDIYKYQRLYREGTVSEPLQHLFIISDEFAELKTQQPEFMTQLVSAARIGRSLGVHLILATQKPSGVVDDQIWSNSKFKVCLKVQERADSMDMLKRPEAAELTDTGRFYLQVGYNELFELGQSAWSGAPYIPSDRVVQEKDDSVVVIDNNGHTVKQVKINRNKNRTGNEQKQLDAITSYLRKTADDEGIKVHPLWLEPLPAIIMLDQVKEKYKTHSEHFVLNPVIGEYDDPIHQQQCVLRLPISEEGNVIVYGSSGSGKTTFLNTVAVSLISEHTPDEVNIYMLDFASETLRAFSDAPHVGEVILAYETEKVGNLFKMLKSEVDKRKKLFADFGGDYQSYVTASDSTVPSIVVMINNYAAFAETFEEKEEAIAYLSREGSKYGIYFVLTALGTSDVRFRMLQNFKQLFVLQLNDEADYSSVVGKTDGLFPAKYRGRGLVKKNDLYEFQIASIVKEGHPYSYIVDFCNQAKLNWNGDKAKRVPILPEIVDSDFLKDYINDKSLLTVPIGVEKSTLSIHYYSFERSFITLALSRNEEYKEFISALVSFIDTQYDFGGIVIDITQSVSDKPKSFTLASNIKDAELAIAKLFDLVLYRNNTYKDSISNGTTCEEFSKVVVVISSLDAIKKNVSKETNEKFSLILEKGSLEYNINIIIGEQSKALSGVSYEKWYKDKVSQSDGIWIGSGITEQYQLKANKTTNEMHEDITKEFGYVLHNGKSTRIKLLGNGQEENGDE